MGVYILKLLKNKGFVIGACLFLLILILFVVSVIRAYGSTDKICSNITAGGVSIGKLTVDEATKKLSENLNEETFDTPVKIVLGEIEKTVIPSDFLVAYDYRATAEKAMLHCRKGNFFQRVGHGFVSIFKKDEIQMEISYDAYAYEEILDELLADIEGKVQEHSWEIRDDKLIVTTGFPGTLPDKKAIFDAVLQFLKNGNYNEKIVFNREQRNPTDLSADYLYGKVCSSPKDASYTIENNKIIIHEHTLGVNFNKAEAQKIIDANKGFGITFEIPLEIVRPNFTNEDIDAELFADKLGDHTTTFNTGDVSRSKNIALASNKINGTILAPGEVFSYNDVVGERSYSEGFENAGVYVNGETVQGVGGGICQVSSTLFNAVVFANLEIVERVNHQLSVSYVPLGRDATVDYGNIDFRFRNNTENPIKIVCTAEGGKMFTGIYGIKKDKSLKVSFDTVVIGHTDPPERKIEDPTLPEGEEKVEKPGSSGFIVDTYKIIEKNGVKGEPIYLFRSSYNGSIREVRVGTGEAVPSPSPGETDSPVPSETTEPEPSETDSPKPTPSKPVTSAHPTETEEPQNSSEPTPTEESNDVVSENGL